MAVYILYWCVAMHMYTINRGKPFKSNLCKDKSIKSDLSKVIGRNVFYMSVNTDGMRYMCYYYQFIYNACTQCVLLLNIIILSHHNMHTREKHFKCNKCGMVEYDGLHITMHTGEKPFKYNKCAMVKYEGLNSAFHTGEKHFKCNKYGIVKFNGLYILTHII